MKKFIRLFFIGLVSVIALNVSAQTKITLTNVKTGNVVSYSRSQIDSLVYSARLADEEGEEDISLLSMYADEYGLTRAENGYWLSTLDKYGITIGNLVDGYYSEEPKTVIYIPDSEVANAIIFDQSDDQYATLRVAIVQKDGLYILTNPEQLGEEWNAYVDLIMLSNDAGDAVFYSRRKIDMLIATSREAEKEDLDNYISSPSHFGLLTPMGEPWYAAIKRFQEFTQKAEEANELGEYYSSESVVFLPNSELIGCIIFDWADTGTGNALRIAIIDLSGLYVLANPEELDEAWYTYIDTFYQFILGE